MALRVAMITNFFALINLVLELLKLKNQFIDWFVEKHQAEIEKRGQKRDAAVEALKKAESDDEIWAAQEDIVNNSPKP